MLKQWFIKVLSIAVVGVSSVGYSCGDYCGDYSGFYDVGGYNLYTFAVDIGTYVDYSYTDQNWGGGCGSFYSTCGSAYSNNYSLGCDTSGIDLQILTLSNQINAYINTNTLINSGSLAPIDTTCILMGTCGLLNGGGFGMPPGVNTGGNYFPGPTYPTFPTSNPFPTYPINNFPSNPYVGGPFQNPMFPQTPVSPTIQTPPIRTGSIPTPPSVQLPYGSSFTPPSGPITRQDDLKRPPVYQPVTTQTGNDPIRYRVPRGVVTH